MPKLSKNDATDTVKLDGYEGHFGELGDYTVAFETYTADADLAELFKGLPDDRCQCPHWGVVLKGKLKYTTATARLSSTAGEAYYVPPGPPPLPVRGHRGDRVQPDARAAGDDGGRREEHGQQRVA